MQRRLATCSLPAARGSTQKGSSSATLKRKNLAPSVPHTSLCGWPPSHLPRAPTGIASPQERLLCRTARRPAA
eukprot:350648-Chlamydomonas_euryale.AAC.2